MEVARIGAVVSRTSGVDEAPRKSTNEAFVQPLVLMVTQNLKKHHSFWVQNISNLWALEVVAKVHSIDFIIPLPPPTTLVKWSTTENSNKHIVVQSEISELLSK